MLFASAAALTFAQYGAPALARAIASRRRVADPLAFEVMGARWIAGLVLAAVPLALSPWLSGGLCSLGLVPTRGALVVPLALALLLVSLPAVLLSARNPAHRALYPQVRAPVWSRRLLLLNAASWAGYLVGYELLFRGFLLFPLVEALGTWPAIAVGTAIYVTAHFSKGAGETAGTLPMGILFALAALLSGSIWAPLLAHLTIAVTNDLATVRANPEMRLDLLRISSSGGPPG